MNNLEPVLLCKADFDCVGQVAKHCDWDQLCMFIREQQNLSLLPKIGQCLFDKLLKYQQGWYDKREGNQCNEQEYDVLSSLFLGGRYESCDGTMKVHFGLKRVLVHWVYGAYMYRHGIVDTAMGPVQKINQDSVPIDVSLLKTINNEQRSNAAYYFKLTKDYMCCMKDCPALADCKICDCIKDCLCDHCKSCKDGKTEQSRNPKFRNVSKFD